MITREEKNKVIQKEITKEKNINNSKIALKIVLFIGTIFVILYLSLRFFGTNFIKTKEYMLKNTDIPTSFHGMKILHFSDLLYGSTINQKDLNYLTSEFKKIKPDIVIFTGDIIADNYNLSKKELENITKFFQDIPYTIGKFAVKGDFDTSTFDLIMNESEFKVLDNEYKLIYYKENTPIALIGFNSNDINYTNINNDEINSLYKISFIHDYDKFDQNFYTNVVFAGHNLNGELYIPFYEGLLGKSKYNKSYYEINTSRVYISNGLGSIHNMRMFNHPSINVYRLIAK